jgi:hypothetical protein
MILVLASLFRRVQHDAHSSRFLEDKFGVPSSEFSAPSMTSLSGIPTPSVTSTKDFPASFLEVVGTTQVNSPCCV